MTNYLGYGFEAENILEEIDFGKVLNILKPIEGNWIDDVFEDYKNNPNLDVRELLYGEPYDSLADLLHSIIIEQNPKIKDAFTFTDDNIGSSWLFVEPNLPWEAQKPITKEEANEAFVDLLLSITNLQLSPEEIINKYQIGNIFVDSE